MGLATSARLSLMFAHSSGNSFGAAIDHFAGYGDVREGSRANLPAALAKVACSFCTRNGKLRRKQCIIDQSDN